MAWIDTVADDAAEGLLKTHYDAAIGRAGKVFGIVRLMSPNPGVLEASMKFYMAVMFGPSPLSRAQREMIATVTARANDCHY